MIETNPDFWQQWEQLGHAVVLRAVQDYINARKKAERLKRNESSAYGYIKELRVYERFFRSKYFGYICPEYDGHVLIEILNTNWDKMSSRKYKHGTRRYVDNSVGYIPVKNPKKRGRPRNWE